MPLSVWPSGATPSGRRAPPHRTPRRGRPVVESIERRRGCAACSGRLEGVVALQLDCQSAKDTCCGPAPFRWRGALRAVQVPRLSACDGERRAQERAPDCLPCTGPSLGGWAMQELTERRRVFNAGGLIHCRVLISDECHCQSVTRTDCSTGWSCSPNFVASRRQEVRPALRLFWWVLA